MTEWQPMEQDPAPIRSSSPTSQPSQPGSETSSCELPLVSVQVGNKLLLAGLCREDIADILRFLLTTLEQCEHLQSIEHLFTDPQEVLDLVQDAQ
jgi:hypothetical protein